MTTNPPQTGETFPLPRVVARGIRFAVRLAGKVLYGVVFRTDIAGHEHIPRHTNVLVVSNHCSHLDYGFVAHILGAQGPHLYVLAAQDYFFNSTWKRTYYGHCTNLLPFKRGLPLEESLREAHVCLERNNNLLVFPEGTRSLDGRMTRFKRTAAFLCLKNKVDVLPVYLTGTFECLPKGARFFRSRRIGARVGPVIPYDSLAEETIGKGMKFSEATLHVTALIQRAVECLRDGVPWDHVPGEIGSWSRDRKGGLTEPAPAEGRSPERPIPDSIRTGMPFKATRGSSR